MGKLIFEEYIIVNNDSERDGLLDYFTTKGIKWHNGQDPHGFIPYEEYPYGIKYSIVREGYIRITWNGLDFYDFYVEYSEFNNRKDSDYTLYRIGSDINVIILVHYTGKGITLDIDYGERIFDVNYDMFKKMEIIDKKFLLKRKDGILMKNIDTKSVLIGYRGINKAFKITSDGLYKTKLDMISKEWVEVDEVLFN